MKHLMIICFRWFCHFDDDNYVNVAQLQLLLSEHDPSLPWYLGKPSVASPLEIKLSEVSSFKAENHSGRKSKQFQFSKKTEKK